MLAGVWLGIVLVFKTASIASLVAMASYVPAFAVTGHPGWSLAWAGATAALVVARHWPNIRRLVSGSESRVSSS